jgi:hypothetical protein
LEGLRERFQEAGYRVESLADAAGATVLRSATGGMPFDIRPGSRFPDAGDGSARYADMTLRALLMVRGVLPLELINVWNNSRRFGRLHLDQGFLILDLDVSVMGGIDAAHLRAQIELWDRLVHDLITYLRNELPKLPAANGKPAIVAEPLAAEAAPSASN